MTRILGHLLALSLSLPLVGCFGPFADRSAAGAVPAPSDAPFDLLVRNSELVGGKMRIDLIVKSNLSEQVSAVAVDSSAWAETVESFVRAGSDTQTVELRLGPGEAKPMMIDAPIPAAMPGPLSIVSLRARPVDAEPTPSQPSRFRRDRMSWFASQAGVAVASVHDRLISALVTNHRGTVPTGYVMRLRGTITNHYASEVHGVRYRVKFLERQTDDARVLGSDAIERRALKIAPGETKALSIDLESSYVGVRNSGFVLEAWPMKLGGSDIAKPKGW